VPGVYAIKVSGQLPDEIRSSLEDEYRIQYIPYVFFQYSIRQHDAILFFWGGRDKMADLMILGETARRPKPMLKRAKMDIYSIIWLTAKERRIRRFGNRSEVYMIYSK
jgi:hypothetical protein